MKPDPTTLRSVRTALTGVPREHLVARYVELGGSARTLLTDAALADVIAYRTATEHEPDHAARERLLDAEGSPLP